MFEIFLSSRAEKGMKSAPEYIRNKLRETINALKRTYFPKGHDIKKMKGVENTCRVRVGNYRMIYRVDFEGKRIFILAIGKRGNVYG